MQVAHAYQGKRDILKYLNTMYALMPKFKIHMHGTHTCWSTDWGVGKKITLWECTFIRTNLDQTQNMLIELELEAPNEDDARDLGKDIISKEIDLFALCVENPLFLDINRIYSDQV